MSRKTCSYLSLTLLHNSFSLSLSFLSPFLSPLSLEHHMIYGEEECAKKKRMHFLSVKWQF